MTKVLIVDDEDLLSNAYRMGLTKAGFDVQSASKVNEVVEVLTKNKQDIIMMDMLMPDTNGIDLYKILKSKKLLGKAKVVAFSNIENPAVIEATKKIGFADYLLKVNYTPAELATYIKKII